MVQIRDISNVVNGQQKMCDKMYEDAIETNYSHEQMTPLNSIINNSKLAESKIKDLVLHEQYHNGLLNKQ